MITRLWRIALTGCVCLLILTGIARAQQPTAPTVQTLYGVPPAGAQTLDLSGSWRVNTVTFLDDKMTRPDFDDHDWRAVSVPSHWRDQGIEATSTMPKVAIYRRTFRTLDSWGTQRVGVSAWLYPGHSTVTLNGKRLEPKGDSPWFYAEVTDLLNKSRDNTLAVTTQFDGIYEMAFPNPPRIGPLDKWDIPTIRGIDIALTVSGNSVKATLYTLDSKPRPGVLMMGTGSHGLAFTEPFIPLARELAYAGYAVLPVALSAQTPENITSALDGLRALPQVDKTRIGVVAGVSSATTLLDQVAGHQTLAAIVSLSAKEAPGARGLSTPVLLIATTSDQTGPASTFAKRIGESLAGPHTVVILPGNENGLSILDPHWNDVRKSILDWFNKYLATPHDQ